MNSRWGEKLDGTESVNSKHGTTRAWQARLFEFLSGIDAIFTKLATLKNSPFLS
jgi:hypothetical protein